MNDPQSSATPVPSGVGSSVHAPPSLDGGTASDPSGSKGNDYRRAFLLQQLLTAPSHKLNKGQANQQIGAAVRRALDLDPAVANQLREELAEQGYIQIYTKKSNVSYELTDAGRQYLQTLEPYSPPGHGEPAPVSAEVQQYRKSYLLFQLFKAERHSLGKKAANRFDALGRKYLELTATAANRMRKSLADQGRIEIIPQGRSGDVPAYDRWKRVTRHPGSLSSLRFQDSRRYLERATGGRPGNHPAIRAHPDQGPWRLGPRHHSRRPKTCAAKNIATVALSPFTKFDSASLPSTARDRPATRCSIGWFTNSVARAAYAWCRSAICGTLTPSNFAIRPRRQPDVLLPGGRP